jgi:MFS family permease
MHDDSPRTVGRSRAELGFSRDTVAYGACLLAIFMLTVDLTVVTVVLPVLSHRLSATPSAQLLVISGYSVAFGCALLAAGWVGQSLGPRRVFLVAVCGFAAASVWCACASSAAELVSARVVQGLCAAAVNAQIIAIVVRLFPPEKYDRAFSGVLAMGALAGLAGPPLGGLLVSANLFGLGWRWVFLVNVPVSLAVLCAAWRSLPPDRRDPDLAASGRPDLAGLVISTVAVLTLLDALLGCRDGKSATTILAEFGSAAALSIVFVLWQVHASRRGHRTVVRMRLFRDRSFAIPTALTAGLFGLFTAMLFVLTITMQDVLGFSPLRSAMVSTPFAAGAVAGAVSAPGLTGRFGARAPAAGIGVFGLCLLAFVVYLLGVGRVVDPALIVVPAVLAGAGYGLFAAPLQAMALRGLAADDAVSVSGLVPALEQIGGAVGLTAVASLAFRSHTLGGSVTAISVLAVYALTLGGLCLLVPDRHPA